MSVREKKRENSFVENFKISLNIERNRSVITESKKARGRLL